MQWIPEILKLSVVLDASGPSAVELQRLEKREFLFRGVSTQACICKELLKARLQNHRPLRFRLHEFEPLPAAEAAEGGTFFRASSLEI
jgi:hypothetical protein